ncbi:Bug family tripartite tricarboxylate transporter substrate binding protein [Zwartia vadi]|uniref:Bug family tripartite tricarboxylate transporter substrate binding protein n=1 Tax=Zwartia vadi TaxID=3058168 RepID=UPI0025B4EE76|nr:tripartite tricarboxylate transporter substrate binding protein [Zwartia vadi]MDN3987388.1 tripartite tricarboxylate transporter substrate binding protein [Zwartia vadi]
MLSNPLSKSLLALTLVFFALTPIAAEKYPNKPIQLIVPYTPGGNTDILGRLIALKLGEAWGARVIVENRPGAGGTIGVNMVAKAKPDGHTLALAAFGNIIVAKSLYKDLPYDPVNDLDPVILVATPPTILTATASLPANNVKELIAYGKANPGVLNYGSSGKGTSNHLFAELFSSMSGVDMTHVPYKGSGPAINDLVAGLTQLNFAPQPLVLSSIKTGALKALAVTGAERMQMLPDVPTVSESGLPGYQGLGWFGVVAPKGTPPEIINKLNVEINRILESPDVRKRLTEEGATPVGGSSEDAKRSISEGIEKWKDLASKVQ